MDTSIVKVYKQTGGTPNPAADELLGTDKDFPGGVWSIDTSGWTEGRYTIYSVAYDAAGNESGFTTRNIGVLPQPMRVSGLVNWYLGELDEIYVGETDV